MEFPFRLRIAKANCAKPLVECVVWRDAVLPVLVDAQEIRLGWASMSEEELIWVEEGYCIAASSTNVRWITYAGFEVSRSRQ